MTISELIEDLSRLMKEHGDLQVYVGTYVFHAPIVYVERKRIDILRIK